MKHHHVTARAMTALSHPRRVALFEILENAGPGGFGFEDLIEKSGLGVTTLRHHLRTMQAAKLVTRRRKGVNVFFRLCGRSVLPETEQLSRRLRRLPAVARASAEPPPLT